MNETEYKLRKENAQLMMALAQAQSQLMQIQFDKAKSDMDALGTEYKPEAEVLQETEVKAD